MQITQSDRLTLRWLDPSDADFVLRLVNEPGWLKYIGDRNIHTQAAAIAYIDKTREMYTQHGFGLFAVERHTDAEVIGICGLLKRDTLEDVDIGFAFLQAFWGKGYAREAANATLDYGKATHDLSRIVAITDPQNQASIALLAKLGFQFEQTLEDGAEPLNLYGIAL